MNNIKIKVYKKFFKEIYEKHYGAEDLINDRVEDLLSC